MLPEESLSFSIYLGGFCGKSSFILKWYSLFFAFFIFQDFSKDDNAFLGKRLAANGSILLQQRPLEFCYLQSYSKVSQLYVEASKHFYYCYFHSESMWKRTGFLPTSVKLFQARIDAAKEWCIGGAISSLCCTDPRFLSVLVPHTSVFALHLPHALEIELVLSRINKWKNQQHKSQSGSVLLLGRMMGVKGQGVLCFIALEKAKK